MGQAFSRSPPAEVPSAANDKEPLPSVLQGDTQYGDLTDNKGIVTGGAPVRPPRRQPDKADTIPLWRNRNFHGRTADLEAIHSALSGNLTDPTSAVHQNSCLVYGIGGIGKTQVALEYVHRYRDSYNYIFWIRSQTEPEMVQDMTKILDILNLDRPENAGSGAIADVVRTWFTNTTESPWLIVFDNVESLESLTPYRPRSNHGSVLLTSQNAGFGSQTTFSIGLTSFSAEEAAAFLLKHLKTDGMTDQHDDAIALCKELGGLPLAIAHIAGYMTASSEHLSPRETLDLFKDLLESNDVFNSKPNTTFGYDKALNAVWDIALRELDADARKLIRVLSMLNPDGVPEDMLKVVTSENGLEFLANRRKTQFQALIQNLSRRQLITLAKPSGKKVLMTHRSLQRSILHSLDGSHEDGDNLQSIFEAALALLRNALPDHSAILHPKNGLWKMMELYSPHVMSLRKVYAESPHSLPPSIEFARVLSNVANYFWERNLFSQGVMACDSAEQICAAFDGQFLKDQSDVYAFGAAIRSNEGISSRREFCLRLTKSLSLRQQYINGLNAEDITIEDVAHYAGSWSDVGTALMEWGSFEQAIPYFDFAMAIRDRIDEDSYRMNMQNIAMKSLCLAELGRLEESMDLIVPDSEFETWPKEFLDDVLLTLLTFKLCWSTIYLRAGKVEKAYEIMCNILDVRLRCFGPFSRATLDVYYLLAMIERQRSDPSAAEDWLRRALAKPEEWTNESKIRAQYHLGKLLLLKGDQSSAEVLFAEARSGKIHLLQRHGSYLPKDFDHDDDAIYDHLVHIGAGRIAPSEKIPALTPKMDKICLTMKQNLEAAFTHDKVIAVGEIFQYLRYTGEFPQEFP
ncbi:conserved hypothetical protein [Talaromyces stipitatus ATCC 10500]|uniref:DUF7779 domain-containing protein n=1 Tax=Talaromyces stipitatus (strain ATCC 10500 / CBS 375.48 / QM 6759 / NRRL 1006) TaxID=441959 RepID=B8MSJ9_TALSN|nr:uncharacterized protein TSTA_001500 [Talaromyces stipitatus ATCC 10500]EED12079.1 conserved hypothetical protein [Talaromyces stipitatus ATCC 10500]